MGIVPTPLCTGPISFKLSFLSLEHRAPCRQKIPAFARVPFCMEAMENRARFGQSDAYFPTNREFPQTQNVDVGVNVDVGSHPVGYNTSWMLFISDSKQISVLISKQN